MEYKRHIKNNSMLIIPYRENKLKTLLNKGIITIIYTCPLVQLGGNKVKRKKPFAVKQKGFL